MKILHDDSLEISQKYAANKIRIDRNVSTRRYCEGITYESSRELGRLYLFDEEHDRWLEIIFTKLFRV